MKDGHTTKSESSFGKKLWCVLIVVFLGGIGWQMWKLNAVRQAKEAGFIWKCDDPISLIQENWRNALRKETWGAHDRVLIMGDVPDFGRYREMLHRLHPTLLYAGGCENVDGLEGLTKLQLLRLVNCPRLQNVNGLKVLTNLQYLDLDDCTALRSVDALKGLTGLPNLRLAGCTALQNLDALKGLTTLRSLSLFCCTALQNVDALKGLTGLQWLHLGGCTALQNVDGLKGLSGLKSLYLKGCDKIPAAALRELRTALPKTDITFPDGTKNPPQ